MWDTVGRHVHNVRPINLLYATTIKRNTLMRLTKKTLARIIKDKKNCRKWNRENMKNYYQRRGMR